MFLVDGAEGIYRYQSFRYTSHSLFPTHLGVESCLLLPTCRQPELDSTIARRSWLRLGIDCFSGSIGLSGEVDLNGVSTQGTNNGKGGMKVPALGRTVLLLALCVSTLQVHIVEAQV